MIPYFIFIVLLLWFRGIHNHKLIFILLLLFSALRFDVGWDYMSYYQKAEYFGSAAISWDRYSFIWMKLFEFANAIGKPHLVIMIPAIINVSVIYYCTIQFMETNEDICDSLFIFACYPFFYLGSLSTIRQSLGVSLALLMLYLIRRRNVFCALGILILNYFIHPSSIISVLYFVFLIPNLRFSIRQIWLILVVVVMALGSIVMNVNMLGLTEYIIYVEEGDNIGSKLILLLLVIAFFLIYSKKKVDGAIDPFKGLLLDVVIIGALAESCVYIFTSFSIVARMVSYFFIALMYVMLYVFKLANYDKILRQLVILSFIGLFFLYLYIVKDATSNLDVSSGFVPYKCILFEK